MGDQSRRGDTNNSIVVYVQTTDHIIKWEDAEIISRAQDKKKDMYIQTSRCQGMSLDPIIPSINKRN